MDNQSTIKRDFLLLMTLLVIGRMAMKLKHDDQPIHEMAQMISQDPIDRTDNSTRSPNLTPNLTNDSSFIAPQSEIVPPIEQKLSHFEPFNVSEIDENVLKQIDLSLLHIKQTMPIVAATSLDAMQLQSFEHRLLRLRKSFQHITSASSLEASPAPNIAFKKKQIGEELLTIANKLGEILHRIARHEDTYQNIDSIVATLESNHYTLSKLISA